MTFDDLRYRRLALLVLLAGCAVTGWLVLLPHLLPGHYRAAHWPAAWVGLDALEAAALLGTGLAALRGYRPTVPATVAATALVIDAWFDVCTAASTADVAVAVALAVLGELPLAALAAALASGRLATGRPSRPAAEPPLAPLVGAAAAAAPGRSTGSSPSCPACTFESWAYGTDTAPATDRVLPALDDERMAMMSGRLMDAVPLALAFRGTPVPDARVRFVLTGPAGGIYDVPLGSGGTLTFTLVAGAVAGRRSPSAGCPRPRCRPPPPGTSRSPAPSSPPLDAFARD